MDLSNVVIILGAGAHVPYGFPTGQGLKDVILDLNISAKGISHKDVMLNALDKNLKIKMKICELVDDSRFISEEFSPMPHGTKEYYEILTKEVDSFIDRFAKSSTSSIDYFISRNGASAEDKFIGQAVIGATLNYYEENVPIGYQKTNWIQTLINKYVRDDHKHFFDKPPKFITFNYDRLLEHYLISHLIYHHNFSEKNAIDKVNQLEIIHIYGSLGECKRESFSKFSHKDISKIDIVRGADSRKIEETIDQVLHDAKKIYIFGFGYDEHNTKLLFGRLSANNGGGQKREIISTCHNLGNIEKNRLLKLFKSPIDVEFLKEDINDIIFSVRTFESIKSTSSTIQL